MTRHEPRNTETIHFSSIPHDVRLLFPLIALFVVSAALTASNRAAADPCGMVPPVQVNADDAIKRQGAQKTYLFYKNGIESFVVRPGFEGKVDNFGMLIPFPNVPSIRKVPNNIFPQVTKAIDPPEVTVEVNRQKFRGANLYSEGAEESENSLEVNEVNVKKREAVGMYRTAVLEAGSAEALKRWMDEHGYTYPNNMDEATQDYVEDGWCFVAVKARVGSKNGVNPKPGIREADPQLPEDATFDGNVQAMGFRFRTDRMDAPMRLSAYNDGKLHNITYVLTDDPKRINNIPEEQVRRQVSGKRLYRNVTEPLPVRVIGGEWDDLSDDRKERVRKRRDPEPHNRRAKELFSADLLAARKERLVHGYEKNLKALLDIEEVLNLRGEGIDRLNRDYLSSRNKQARRRALKELNGMTLTVVDGEFPREVLKRENLTFSTYRMPEDRNGPSEYNARKKGPVDEEKKGNLYRGYAPEPVRKQGGGLFLLLIAVFCVLPFAECTLSRHGRRARDADRRRSAHTRVFPGLVTIIVSALISLNVIAQIDVDEEMRKLSDRDRAHEAVQTLVKHPDASLPELVKTARYSANIRKRGWSIIALSRIGGAVAEHHLKAIMNDDGEHRLVRLLAAAGHIHLLSNIDQLDHWLSKHRSSWVEEFPALARPLRVRNREISGDGNSFQSLKLLLNLARTSDGLRKKLADRITGFGVERLTGLMTSPSDTGVRRMAAAYLGTLARRGNRDAVVNAVGNTYAFSSDAEQVPWGGRSLFLPGIEWTKSEATSLVRNLMSWMIWAYKQGDERILRQIDNSISNSRLRRAAGLELSDAFGVRSRSDDPDSRSGGFGSSSGGFGSSSGGFGSNSTANDFIKWLSAWKSAKGSEDLRELFDDQNLFKKWENFDLDSIYSDELKLMLASVSKEFRKKMDNQLSGIGAKRLARFMTWSVDRDVRRLAGSYLKTMAGRGNRDAVVEAVRKVLSFKPGAERISWEGGPLIFPRMEWTKSNVTPVVRDLLSWMIRANELAMENKEGFGGTEGNYVKYMKVKKQIIDLLWNPEGTQSSSRSNPFRDPLSSDRNDGKVIEIAPDKIDPESPDTDRMKKLLNLWKAEMGNEDLKTMLKKQNLLTEDPYQDILD